MQTSQKLQRKLGLILGLLGALWLGPSAAQGSTTLQEQYGNWTAQAKSVHAGFVPSAQRGKDFFNRFVGMHPQINSCAACHTSDPRATGTHVITGKSIAPLAPSANAERFSDAKKSEKWFKRNCDDVLGRECTPAEKSDLAAWLLQH